MAKGKSSNSGNMAYGCIDMSIKYSGKGLGSSTDTVNPFSIRKSDKSIVKGKNG